MEPRGRPERNEFRPLRDLNPDGCQPRRTRSWMRHPCWSVTGGFVCCTVRQVATVPVKYGSVLAGYHTPWRCGAVEFHRNDPRNESLSESHRGTEKQQFPRRCELVELVLSSIPCRAIASPGGAHCCLRGSFRSIPATHSQASRQSEHNDASKEFVVASNRIASNRIAPEQKRTTRNRNESKRHRTERPIR